MPKRKYIFSSLISIILLLTSYAYAAGSGGGGSSSSGLRFGSRDSVFVPLTAEYSEKFSLKNNTKYDLKVNVENGSFDVAFGSYYLNLKKGDNYLDLNGNGLADINFKLESIGGQSASLRIIDAKEHVEIAQDGTQKEKEIAENAKKEEKTEIETKTDNEGLKCSNFPTLKERVECRIGLEEDEREEEIELYYLPEECRVLSGASRGVCIARYKSVQTCWKFPIGAERVSCVKRAIRLDLIQEEKKKCDDMIGENKSFCVREVKNKNYNLIKWRFYDLEERAEDFMHRGFVSKDVAFDFIAKTEQNKINFNDAKTKEERKNIILQVRSDWKPLVEKAKEKLMGER